MTYFEFQGGPLVDGRFVHSLVVHLVGDGRHSVGAYIQTYYDDAKTVPTGLWVWSPGPGEE